MDSDLFDENAFKFGITFGCFDLFHPGHAHLISIMKFECEQTIVGLHVDPSLERPTKNKPVMTLLERYVMLDSIGVDHIVPYETEDDIEKILRLYNINARYLGDDYLDRDFTGKKFCLDNNIELRYTDRSHNWSTSAIRKRVKDA